MFIAILIVHVVVAISLVLIVLLQTGRGAELGAAFGGMGQATYGPGQSTFLSKVTTGLAVIFMSTSLSLAFISSERPTRSVLSDVTSPIAIPAARPTAKQAQKEPPIGPVANPTASPTGEQNADTTPVLPQTEAPLQPANPIRQ